MTREQKEIIQYHLDEKLIMTIDRCFNNETSSIIGFPICLSDEFILTTVIVDFHDEGYAIVRTKDVVDVYSKESDSFNEQICISEGLQEKIHQEYVKEINSLKQIFLQLNDYDGFICIQCEQQLEKCSFYMGKIVAIEDDTVRFKDVGMDGVWDDEVHDIPYEDITQISYGDNYSKMYYKYVTK